jgi:hypothetical protein
MVTRFVLFEVIYFGSTESDRHRRLYGLGAFETHDEALKAITKRIEQLGGIDMAAKHICGFQIDFILTP